MGWLRAPLLHAHVREDGEVYIHVHEPCCSSEADTHFLAGHAHGPDRWLGGDTSAHPWLLFLAEAYYVPSLVRKAPTVLRLRLVKAAALVFTTKVGQVLFSWAPGENRLLDSSAREAGAMYAQLYGAPMDGDAAALHLARRRVFFGLTLSATTLQVVAMSYGFPAFAVVVSLLLAPVTLLERQWCTLVSKLQPRGVRSVVEVLVRRTTKAFVDSDAEAGATVPLFKSLGAKTRRFPVAPIRARLIAGTEMFVGFAQALCACFILLHSFVLVTGIGVGATIGVYVTEVRIAIAARLFKEVCNGISPPLLRITGASLRQTSARHLERFLDELSAALSAQRATHPSVEASASATTTAAATTAFESEAALRKALDARPQARAALKEMWAAVHALAPSLAAGEARALPDELRVSELPDNHQNLLNALSDYGEMSHTHPQQRQHLSISRVCVTAGRHPGDSVL